MFQFSVDDKQNALWTTKKLMLVQLRTIENIDFQFVPLLSFGEKWKQQVFMTNRFSLKYYIKSYITISYETAIYNIMYFRLYKIFIYNLYITSLYKFYITYYRKLYMNKYINKLPKSPHSYQLRLGSSGPTSFLLHFC